MKYSSIQRAFARFGLVGAREMIRASYRGILGRGPSGEEVFHWMDGIAQNPTFLEDSLRGLLRSKESAQRNFVPLFSNLLSGDKQLDITSLGTHCYAGQLLKNLGIKRWSGPFDWIFSSIPMVSHCIEDDFRTFLDRAMLEPVPTERRQSPDHGKCEHRHYRERFNVHQVFNHHDAATDESHAYFVRCVKRLQERLQETGPKTFLLCAHDTPEFLPQLRQLQTVLERVSKRFRVVAMGMRPCVGNPWATSQMLHQDDSLHAYAITPSSAWLPLHFSDPADDLCVARLLKHSMLC